MLKPQDHLIVTVPETESGENIIRTKMDLNIIYEDEDILVINKPADMPVHPSAGNYENTLANGIAVISAIFAEKDIKNATKKLKKLTEEMVEA